MKRQNTGEAPAREVRTMVDRATRHQIQIPLRYRLAGQEEWSLGETVNVSESGVLFSSNQLLELDSRLEITFQTHGAIILERSTRVAQVVRRTLNNWPETRLLFAARFCS